MSKAEHYAAFPNTILWNFTFFCWEIPKRGEIRKAYREGQEDQLNALGLVTNAVVLWNTLYLQAALDHLGAEGMEIIPGNLARLSPLLHKHINVLGRYSFALADPVAQGKLRPLNLEGWDAEA